MSFSFIHNIEQRSAHIMDTVLEAVVHKWRNSMTPIWRAYHHGFDPTARYVTFIFQTAAERRKAAELGLLNQMRDDLIKTLQEQCDVSLRIQIYAITFTDLDADTTFLDFTS
ncbi:MAG: hypothetical protein CUN55_14510 [Phototrophicales bacterium]|nr:MAG: hypothetical protein CUN55_14510 [Phototrophicales bacterium]